MDKTPLVATPDFEWISSLSEYSLNGNTITLTLKTNKDKTVTTDIRILKNDVIDCRFYEETFENDFSELMLIEDLPESRDMNIIDEDDKLIISSENIHIRIKKKEWYIEFLNKERTILRENPEDINGLGQPFILPLGIKRDSVGKIKAITDSFQLLQDEQIFGLGEKFTPLNKVGQKIVTWTQDAFGSTSERSHKNIPFLLSSNGYGLFLRTGARVNWELGTISCQSYTMEAEANQLQFFVIPGKDYAEIIKKYSELTGFSPIPPKWTFGLWISSGGTYRDQESLEKLLDGLESNSMPADVLHIDPWWMHWRKYCDFKWNREAFPQLETFLKRVKKEQLKICLWEHPYISVESELFEFGKKHGFFVKRPDGEVYVIDYGLSLAPRPDGIIRKADAKNGWNAKVAIIDFTVQEACDWYKELHRPLLEEGISVFKTDFGEDIPEDAIFANGETGKTMHNVYPLIYNKIVFEITEEVSGKGVVWARSGTAGNQRYPICWSGDPAADFQSLACTIRGGLSIGMSGVPFWSHDIGGYRGMPTKEVYIRWAQFGLLCSHSRMHADSPREPWYFDEETVDIVRKYAELRYELFPYFYSLAIEASKTGMPVIRSMPLAFPEDRNTFDKDLQFMLGDWILVAPIYNYEGTRSVYLPTGTWYDYHTNQKIQGPINIEVSATLDTLPIYIRGGAMIPKIKNAKRIPEAFIENLILEIYPSESSKYRLYEDKQETTIVCLKENDSYKIGIDSPIKRSFTVRFKGGAEDVQVSIDTDGSTCNHTVPK